MRQTTARPGTDPDPCTGNPGTAGINELLRSYTYNDQHLPLTLTKTDGESTVLSFAPNGQLLTTTLPAPEGHAIGPTVKLDYGTDAYLDTITGPVPGAVTSLTYDGYGRPRTVTDPSNLTLTYDYDALDRTTRQTWPDGTYRARAYERLDVVQTRDRLGRSSRTFYDALRRPVTRRDPAGRTTSYNWCQCGNLESLIDAEGNETSWRRDIQARIVSEERADGKKTQWTYEQTTSRLHDLTDRRGITTTLQYFLDNRLAGKTYSDATAAVTYVYDPDFGWLESAANGSDTLEWSYYLDGRVQTETSAANSSVMGYAYDDADNRVALDVNQVPFVTYGYDIASRLEDVTRGANVIEFHVRRSVAPRDDGVPEWCVDRLRVRRRIPARERHGAAGQLPDHTVRLRLRCRGQPDAEDDSRLRGRLRIRPLRQIDTCGPYRRDARALVLYV